MTCDHAVFWKEKSTCFFLTCPNCTNCSSIAVADLIREHETDISVFKRDAKHVPQSSSSVTPSESQHKNPTAHKLTVSNNANQTTQTSALNETGSTSQHSDAGQAPTAGDSPDVLTASIMNAAPLAAPKNDTATTLSETSHKSKVQSPVTTTATSVKLESTTVMTPLAITQIMTITESETTATTTMTTTTTTAMPSTTNTTTTQPTTTKTTIPTTATTIKTTALPSTTTPKTTTTADTPTDEEKKPSPTIPEAPSSQATSGNAMVPSTATAEVSTKRLDEDTNRAIIDVVAGEILTRQLVDTSALLAVLLFGLLFFLVTVVLFLTQAYKSYRRKDYNQVDYLINGMYSDSGV
ncbi:cell wall protein DAN4 isoform X2 [Oncorhynchus mykiss]|nr:cell wall protein DAN4 isoform X2 [Oncorhynchus mykiss]